MSSTTQTPITVTVTALESAIRACVEDSRSDTLELFADLTESDREQLAHDAWTIGLRALGNAYSQARESRLEDVGRTLLEDLERQLKRQVEHQEQRMTEALQRFFDPQGRVGDPAPGGVRRR